MHYTIHRDASSTPKLKHVIAFYRLVFVTFLIVVTIVDLGTRTLAATANTQLSQEDISLSYLNQLTRTFYWARPVVKYRFTQPERATDLNQNSIPAMPLSEVQKVAVRAGLTKWQTALATNPVEAQRTFVEVRPEEAADIEFILMPKKYFPPNVFGLTQSSWRVKPTKKELTRAVVWMREGLTDEQFEYVVLHEQGHALMSVDHSKVADCVLFPIVPLNPSRIQLTPADAATIRENYRRLSVTN